MSKSSDFSDLCTFYEGISFKEIIKLYELPQHRWRPQGQAGAVAVVPHVGVSSDEQRCCDHSSFWSLDKSKMKKKKLELKIKTKERITPNVKSKNKIKNPVAAGLKLNSLNKNKKE